MSETVWRDTAGVGGNLFASRCVKCKAKILPGESGSGFRSPGNGSWRFRCAPCELRKVLTRELFGPHELHELAKRVEARRKGERHGGP